MNTPPAAADPKTNLLLAALPEAEWQRWQPQLEAVELPLGQVIYESGSKLSHVYFPTNAIVSLLYVMEDGASAGIAVVGFEGLVGISLFMGGETTPSRAVVQSAGRGYRLRAAVVKDEFGRSGPVLLMVAEVPVLAQMVAQFEQRRASIIAVREVPAEQTRRYGIVAGTAVDALTVDIERIVEKPAPEDAPSRLGVAGRYIFTPAVFREIALQAGGVGGEIQLTDGIAGLLRHEKVYAYRYAGERYDCGSREGFLEANVELALAHPELGPGFHRFLRARMDRR